MAKAEQIIHYVNAIGKVRDVPLALAQRETNMRLEYVKVFVPKLKEIYYERGIDIEVEVIGSVAEGAANEESDIDLRIIEVGTKDLTKLRRISVEVHGKDLRGVEHPFEIQFWYCHLMGSEEYENDNE
jgi:predicted nucleotidyltransferase